MQTNIKPIKVGRLKKDLCLSGDHWEVKTAEPRKTEDIIKRKLLWKK